MILIPFHMATAVASSYTWYTNEREQSALVDTLMGSFTISVSTLGFVKIMQKW